MTSMFSSWRRKQTTSIESRPTSIFNTLSSTPPPRPILKTSTTEIGGPSIRFGPGISPPSSSSPTSATFASSHETPRQISRTSSSPTDSSGYGSGSGSTRPPSVAAKLAAKSSRPHSPSTTSFGQRTRCESAPAASPVTRPKTMGSRPNSIVSNRSITPVPSAPMAESSDAMCTPPLPPVMHITTPPMAYVSSMQTRAPPPPSPYRPTHERQRSLTRKMPQALPKMDELAPRPPRHSSLFAPLDTNIDLSIGSKRSSTVTIRNVPVLNVIPATPQEDGQEFEGAWAGPREAGVEKRTAGPVIGLGMLGEAVSIGGDRMEDVPLDSSVNGIPSIEVDLDFSPFRPDVPLPSVSDHESRMEVDEREDDIERTPMARPRPPLADLRRPSSLYAAHEAATQAMNGNVGPDGPLPPSPPFDSYASLPSLESAHTDNTMPSSESDYSLRRSSSNASMSSMDVEHDLEGMLASLSAHSDMSDIQLPHLSSTPSKSDRAHDYDARSYARHTPAVPFNPGLGLGLNIPEAPRITAPLSRRRKGKPEPLDLTVTKRNSYQQEITTAPAHLAARQRPSPTVSNGGYDVKYRYGPSGPVQVIVYSKPSPPAAPPAAPRSTKPTSTYRPPSAAPNSAGYTTYTHNPNSNNNPARRSSFYNDGTHAIPRSRMSMCMFGPTHSDEYGTASGSSSGSSSASSNSSYSQRIPSGPEYYYTTEDDLYSRPLSGYNKVTRSAHRTSMAGSVLSVASLGSVGSDGSDDDLHTACIATVSVGVGVMSPVVLGRGERFGEEVLEEVGVAL